MSGGGMRLVDLVEGFSDRFRFTCPTEMVFGRGVSDELATRVEAAGARHVLVVADRVAATGNAAACLEKLREVPDLETTTWYVPGGEPTIAGIAGGAATWRGCEPDLVIAVGGGSTIDTAKVVAVVCAAPAGVTVADVIGTGSHQITGAVPLWALPTLSGTGAEVTRGTVVADEAGIKHGFSSRGVPHPKLALLDPELAAGVPGTVLGPPTVDLFCHAVESFLTARAFPIGDLLSSAAITLLGPVIDDPLDRRTPESTGNAMIAAGFAAQAFSSGSGMTIAHEYSDIAGLTLGLPHGYAAGLLLPAVIATGAGTTPERVARLGRLFGDVGWSGDPLQAATAALRGCRAPSIAEVCEKSKARELMAYLYEVGDPRHSVPYATALEVIDAAYEAG